jgi:UDP-glucose 4-epimerase
VNNILVTGGAGYIDNHTVVELINAGLACGEEPRRCISRLLTLAAKNNLNS